MERVWNIAIRPVFPEPRRVSLTKHGFANDSADRFRRLRPRPGPSDNSCIHGTSELCKRCSFQLRNISVRTGRKWVATRLPLDAQTNRRKCDVHPSPEWGRLQNPLQFLVWVIRELREPSRRTIPNDQERYDRYHYSIRKIW